MIVFDATRINTGGGKVLLEYFIDKNKHRENITFLLDNRLNMKIPLDSQCQYLTKKKNILFLTKLLLVINRKSKYFSFINIPSIFLSLFQVEQIVYIHNPYIFQNKSLKFKYLRFLIRLSILLNSKIIFWVQTKSVKRGFENTFKFRNIKLMPFYNSHILLQYQALYLDQQKAYDIIYVGLPSKHKNHELLIESLNNIPAHIKFNIAVTIPIHEKFLIDRVEKHNVISHIQIINLGLIAHEEAMQNLARSKCLIFPSLLETYGLPLIEAQIIGLDILASDLAYVYDVIEPTDTFNPLNKDDIRNCILKYISNDNPKKPILKSLNSIKDIEKILFQEEG